MRKIRTCNCQNKNRMKPSQLRKLNKPSIDSGENFNEKKLTSHLYPYIKGIINCLNVVSTAINMHPTLDIERVDASTKVVNLLLMKCVNDLRSLWILSKKGYSIQAASLASSLYESFIQINYIGNNNGRAQEWIDHTDPKWLPQSMKNYTNIVFEELAPEHPELSNNFYAVYSRLCRAKHGNPLLLKNHFYEIKGSNIIADYGPENSEDSIELTCFSIQWSIRFMNLAISSFINKHLSVYNLPFGELVEKYDRISQYHEKLEATYRQKWGNAININ